MKIKVIVAAHKFYMMPRDDMYVPMQVGAAGKKTIRHNFLRDDGGNVGEHAENAESKGNGDHISEKNPTYCELTGLYYAWKNLDYDYLGMAHYRRHFSKAPGILRFLRSQVRLGNSETMNSNSNPHLARVLRLCLKQEQAERLLERCDVIVPAKRRYYIESLYSHYAHTLDGEHLDLAKQIIQEDFKDYVPYVDQVFQRSWGYMFNMFIMPRHLVEDYCAWLFEILGKLEQLIDTSEMSGFEARLFGRVSEILFNVWLLKQQEEQGIKICEVPLLSTEPVNWWVKGSAFLKAKFGGQKYDKSF